MPGKSFFTFTFVCLLLILGIGPARCVEPGKSNVNRNGNLSICEISTNERAFLGKTVEMTAIFETDNGTYAYITDADPKSSGCRTPKTIDVMSVSPAQDVGVKKFFNESRRLCNDGAGVCIQRAVVDFRAKVDFASGSACLFLTRVFSYKFK
jgi:hypothetical protein